MTSPYVTVTQPPRPAAPSAWPVVRAILAVLVLLIGLVLYVMIGFAAVVTWSGCFIECTGTDHRGGAELAMLAVAVLAAAPAIVAALYRSRGWLWAAGFVAAGGAVLVVLGLSAN